ncbi:MAG: DUF3644 domain-containing protein [Candidatus Omnitrophica bacterium]|nr:DUF3644 domain-containing protein [Candidatus Omnitrophota bacterium]
MRKLISLRFVEKAEAAMVASVEIFNKPSFGYKEETFALLMINAWELLLKGKLLADNDNNVKAIRVYERRQTRSGQMSRKLYVKRNRSGNPVTLSLHNCIVQLDDDPSSRLPNSVKQNLEAMIEIRDNAAHFIHVSPVLVKQVLEIASASIQNFVLLCKRWFDLDLSKSLSLILPLSFIGGTADAAVVSVSPDERNLIKYLQEMGRSHEPTSDPFYVALRIDVNMQRSKLDSASIVEVSKDPGAVKVTLSEEDIRQRYPWDYGELAKRLNERYSDFKQNNEFHEIKRPLLSDPKLTRTRLLDPGNPKSPKKVFYSPNILGYFDEHYTLK